MQWQWRWPGPNRWSLLRLWEGWSWIERCQLKEHWSFEWSKHDEVTGDSEAKNIRNQNTSAGRRHRWGISPKVVRRCFAIHISLSWMVIRLKHAWSQQLALFKSTYRSFLATPGGVLLSCSRHADVFQEPQVQLAMQEAGPKRHSRAQGADAAMLYSRQLIFSGLADFFLLLWVVQHGLNTEHSWATARQYQHSGRSARQGGTVGWTEWFLYRQHEWMHRTRLRLQIRGPLLPLASYWR